jgi:hypothetical protein
MPVAGGIPLMPTHPSNSSRFGLADADVEHSFSAGVKTLPSQIFALRSARSVEGLANRF